jgi:hypothetical protein
VGLSNNSELASSAAPVGHKAVHLPSNKEQPNLVWCACVARKSMARKRDETRRRGKSFRPSPFHALSIRAPHPPDLITHLSWPLLFPFGFSPCRSTAWIFWRRLEAMRGAFLSRELLQALRHAYDFLRMHSSTHHSICNRKDIQDGVKGTSCRCRNVWPFFLTREMSDLKSDGIGWERQRAAGMETSRGHGPYGVAS